MRGDSCVTSAGCDHLLFVRGLSTLFEDRQRAMAYFQQVATKYASGRYAAASRTILDVLELPSVQSDLSWMTPRSQVEPLVMANGLLKQALEHVVRDLLYHEADLLRLTTAKDAEAATSTHLRQELAEQQHRFDELQQKKDKEKESVRVVQDPAAHAAVSALQVQLEQRDKRIAELTNQLDALKRIDQETREKTRPTRPLGADTGETKPTP
ncbi:MAG: hypothetical protein U0172_02875 [Nitrospiraceae bacterium]